MKSIFQIFKGLLVVKNCLRPESAPVSSKFHWCYFFLRFFAISLSIFQVHKKNISSYRRSLYTLITVSMARTHPLLQRGRPGKFYKIWRRGELENVLFWGGQGWGGWVGVCGAILPQSAKFHWLLYNKQPISINSTENM